MQEQIMKCDFCNKQFKMSDKKIKREWLDEEKTIQETYFKCPKCNHKYIISITDEDIRETMKECLRIDNEVRNLSDSVTKLVKLKDSMVSRAGKKEKELNKQWKQQS